MFPPVPGILFGCFNHWRWGNYVASESQEPFCQWCSVIFQKNGIVSYTTV